MCPLISSRETDDGKSTEAERPGESSMVTGPGRSPKSCRLRWNRKLKFGINQKPFSEEEEATIIKLQKQHGNKWATIAKHMPGRTDTGIKNFWNNRLKLSKKETPSLVNLTPLHQPLETADLLTCAVNDLRDEVLKLHSDASFTWYPRHGHAFHPTDEELILTSLPPLPPQTPSFHYQQAMEDQQVCPRNPDGSVLGLRVFQMQVPFLRRFQLTGALQGLSSSGDC
ncbi:Transcription factor MYB44 [Vitis vinifera]|uniref:Transcription factor MYB44 n=1 Tax=Vitis vinifera TaxID=29760 RepID=A0A438BQK9_VITVI|nr:Transcription factor MYB44 [Vitis vinifera]